MPQRFDVYGFGDADIGETAAAVEAALGLRLARRDSAYWGIYYQHGSGPGNDVMLYTNNVGEWAVDAHRGIAVVLLVNDLPDMDAIRVRLAALSPAPALLRSSVLPDPPPDDDD